MDTIPLTRKQYTALFLYCIEAAHKVNNYSLVSVVRSKQGNGMILTFAPRQDHRIKLELMCTWDNHVITIVQRAYYYGTILQGSLYVTEKQRKNRALQLAANDFTNQCPK